MESLSSEQFVSSYESEQMITCIQQIDIEEYGSKKWLEQHKIIDTLNMQAHRNAAQKTEEYVMQGLSDANKVKDLIYILLVSEAWKKNLYPLVKKKVSHSHSLKGYLLLYHEATLINIIEIIFFHLTAVLSSGDSIIELIEYCYRKTMKLENDFEEKGQVYLEDEDIKDTSDYSEEKELDKHFQKIEISIQFISLAAICCIVDHVKDLPLSVIHQLCENTDFLMLLVRILDHKPWVSKNSKGERLVYEDQKWKKVENKDFMKVTKLEAQLWLSVYSLFLTKNCADYYQLTNSRKDNMLKLRKYLNETLIDQIPILANLLKVLEQLSITEVPSISNKSIFMVQQIPEFKNKIYSNKNWKEIAEYQIKHYFNQSKEEMKEELDKIVSLYDNHLIEEMMEDPRCGNCGKPSTLRCSRCKHEWYCSVDCQKTKWKDHKPLCDIFSDQVNKSKSESNTIKPKEEVKKQLIVELD